jgi:hypothetical protein
VADKLVQLTILLLAEPVGGAPLAPVELKENGENGARPRLRQSGKF